MSHYEDFTIDKGSDITVEIYFVNKDGSKKDLTSYSAAAALTPYYGADSAEVINFTSDIINPPADGQVNISLTNGITDTLDARKRYYYDVELSYFDSDLGRTIIKRALEGKIKVSPSVTN